MKLKKTKLRMLLESRNLSAAEFSKKVPSVSKRTIQAIAQGARQPSIEAARLIAKALRVKIDEIF